MQSTMGSYDELHRDEATSYLLRTQGWGLTAHPQQGGCRTSKRRTTAYSRGGDAPGIDFPVGTPAKGLAVQDAIVLRHTEGFRHFSASDWIAHRCVSLFGELFITQGMNFLQMSRRRALYIQLFQLTLSYESLSLWDKTAGKCGIFMPKFTKISSTFLAVQ